MAPKPKKAGRYPGPGYDETGPGVPKYNPKIKDKPTKGETERGKMAKAAIAKRNQEKSRQYSPAPMSAAAKKKAARAGQKTQAVIGIKKDVRKIAGAAGKAVGFATKAAMAPSELLIKGAKAGAKALAKEVRGPKRGVAKGDPLKNLKNIKKAKKK
jgi:hypothetical protein